MIILVAWAVMGTRNAHTLKYHDIIAYAWPVQVSRALFLLYSTRRPNLKKKATVSSALCALTSSLTTSITFDMVDFIII